MNKYSDVSEVVCDVYFGYVNQRNYETMFSYESISKYCAGRRELCLYLSVLFFHARSFKETCVFRKVLDPSQPGAIRCTYPVYVLVKF